MNKKFRINKARAIVFAILVIVMVYFIGIELVKAGGGTSNLDTLYWRFRDDSTALNTSGGWLTASENQQATDLVKGTTYRLRINDSQEGTKKSTTTQALEYGTSSDCSSGSWVAVANNGAVTTEHFEMVSSGQYTDGDQTTTNLLSSSATTWINGEGISGTNDVSVITYDIDEYSEHEIAFTPTTNVTNGGTYYMRLSSNDSWTACASLTMETPTGSLTVDIVDSGGSSVSSPSMAMNSGTVSFTYQTTTGTFGVSSEKIRVSNTTASPQWTLSLAGFSTTSFWDSVGTDYDFNDPTASAGDGGDADSLGGQMTVDASVSTITPEGGCTTTGLTKGTSTGFSEGVTDSITLVTAGATADTSCYWDVTGVSISQTIPAEQPAASDYNIDMVLSVVAS